MPTKFPLLAFGFANGQPEQSYGTSIESKSRPTIATSFPGESDSNSYQHTLSITIITEIIIIIKKPCPFYCQIPMLINKAHIEAKQISL